MAAIGLGIVTIAGIVGLMSYAIRDNNREIKKIENDLNDFDQILNEIEKLESDVIVLNRIQQMKGVTSELKKRFRDHKI